MERTAGELYLGQVLDASGQRTDEAMTYDMTDLTTHGVIVGMTGSGKTGLGIVAIEELLTAGVPTLVIDPKGDMGNLALTFPGLSGADFRPWVNEGDAQRAGQSVDEFAAAQAEQWRSGLERSGLGPADIEQLHASGRVTIYTPGSESGAPLNVIGNMAAPPEGSGAESVREEAAAIATGLLNLVGIEADPLASREHILLSNLIEGAWAGGDQLDLATLIARTLEPPVRKLGVFEIDTFFPADDRRALALRLNALVASASFAAWTAGEPLDVGQLLRDPDGRPRVSILYLAHLSDAERQFVVSLVLTKVITWMRAQSGTTDLRALVYMDELFGFAPPTAEPPAKRPLLTLLKQARAYGVGLLLSTQNPVDLDYKAMSNAGTWMIGRLQTERDKERVLEGLRSASAELDAGSIEALLANLGPRQFLMHNTHDRGGPRLFTPRWAMSYLRGPLTREQIASLTPAATATPAPAANVSAPSSTATAAPAAVPQPTAAASDASLVPPTVAAGVASYYVDSAAPWLAEVGGRPGTRLEPAIVARLYLRFDEASLDLDHSDEWEAVLFPLGRIANVADARNVDYDARDLRSEAPAGASYAFSDAPLGESSFFRDLERDLKDQVTRAQRMEVQVNRKLKLAARAGETPEEFAKRCDQAGQNAADAEAAKLRDRYDAKADRIRDAINRAEDRVDVLKTDTSTRRTSEILGAAGDLLGAFLGGRHTTRSMASGAGRILRGASSRRGQSARTSQRLDVAESQLQDRQEDLDELEAELAREIAEINDRWADVARDVETVEVPLEKTDVSVQEVALAWIPVGN
ncbi:MAG: DUF853 family protein [Dehalococcoidia bacterium]|nr:DUF853 family protein [Dehalococcoidia bacterium]